MPTHRTHWRRSLAVLLAALAIGAAAGLTVAGSQRAARAQAPDVAGLPRTITVVGEGTVTLQPDIATAQIGVEVSGPTARAASVEAARIMEAILAALEAQGVAAKDIQTSNYSIFAERISDAMTGRPNEQVTYRVNSGVAVTTRDLATVGALLDGPATPEMASFLPQFASTIQLTDAALASAQDKPSLPAAYQATMATRQAMQSATPALDIVARDATAAAQLTPGPRATYGPEMQTQEAVYYRSLETATAVALLTTPTPTPTPLPTATPIPSGRPGYALYRGRGVYYETPRLQVEYDMSQWSLLALDYFDQAHLVNRQWPDCVLRLQGGPRMMLGPAVVEWITLDEQQWTRTDWRGDHTFIYYPSDADDPKMMNFMIELRYGAAASREEVVACRSAAELVLGTFKALD